MKLMKNDEAVSPVIGVILMVAITVILAAVIAAFVFGMAGQTKGEHNIGLATSYNAGNIEMVYHGGDGAATLTGISVELNGVAQPDWLPAGVGSVNVYTAGAPFTRPTKALVIARYSDGAEQVVLSNVDI